MKQQVETLLQFGRKIWQSERTQKFVNWVFFPLLIAILIFVAVPLLPNAPYSLRMVTSNSMRPAFNTGAMVVITPAQSYEVGEVITYQASKHKQDIVTHRIVEKTPQGFKTKGDANDTVDDREVTKEQIHGKVVFHIPWAGYFASFAQRPVGFTLLVIMPALIIIGNEARKIYEEINKNE